MPQLPAASDVIAITGSELGTAIIDALIADAVLLGGDCIAGLSGDKQEAAIKWLAAHLVASTFGGGAVTSKKLGDAQESYAQAQTGNGIMGTVYGQQAIALAPCLARLGRARASIKVV